MIGQTINNRYQVETLLGRGGMGSVYRATDLGQNRVVALKFLDLYRGEQSEAALTRFQREFRVLTRLNHPHIIQAYEFGSHKDTPYFALEFLDGDTLSTEIDAAPLPRERTLQLALQICNPLTYLHSKTIVHRDLKSDNLMLVKNGTSAPLQIKLMDFGLVHQAGLSMQLTQGGMVLGTVAYMAPEQAQGFPVDFRTDLYALGAILYQMTTGQLPFTADNPAVMLMNLLSSTPPAPHQINSEIDSPLSELILQLLAKEPSERPASTEAVTARLAALANETSPAATVVIDPLHHPGRIDLIPRIPLIGREKTLTQLRQIWNTARAGQGQVVLLAGLAGAGKTRLLDEIRPHVRLEQGWVVRSHCHDQGALPYQPITTILEDLLHRLPETVTDALPTELTRLLPGNNSEGHNLPDESDQAEARRRLFVACWEVIQHATEDRPLQLIIEDLQWTDPATLDLIDYLMSQTDQTRLLLTLTYRSEEFDPAAKLAMLRQDVGRQAMAKTIDLTLLNREQVARFLQQALSWPNVPEWLIDNFYQATDGNPLFIEETLKALAAEGQIATWKAQDTGQIHKVTISQANLQLPQNVLDLAQRRLQLLTDEDRTILTTAAVLGQEFPFMLLETVARLEEEALLDAVERLLAARLIEELPLQDGEDRYRFAQEALRQALLTNISQRRQRLLHRRAGEAIQSIYDTSQRWTWPLLAHHFALAGNESQALKYFILSGDAAARVYANIEAINYFGRVLEIAKQAQTVDPPDVLVQLCTRLGRALELNAQFEQALAHYETIGQLANDRNDQALALTALLARITLYAAPNAVHNSSRAEVLSEEALTLARKMGDRAAEVKLLRTLINVYAFTNRVSQAISAGEQALSVARGLDLTEEMAFILTDVGRFCMMSNRIEQGRTFLSEASTLWQALDNLPLLADSLNANILLNIYLTEYEEALAISDKAYQINLSIDNVWGQSHSRYKIGQIYWDRGQAEQAITITEKAITLAEQAGFVVPQVIGRADLAIVYTELGAFKRALEIGHLALKVQAERMPASIPYNLASLVHTYVLQGNFDEAKAMMDRHKQSMTSGAIPAFVIPATLAEGEFLLANGDLDEARQVLDTLLTTLNEAQMHVYVPQTLYLLGQTLLGLGDTEAGHQLPT